MKKEDQLQIAVADYLRFAYPDVLWAHIGNERQTSPQRGAKLKRMGVLAGVSDILIFEPGWKNKGYNDYYHGCAIELKIKPNKLTEKQKEFLERIKDVGWQTAICYSFDEAKEVIDNYLGK